MQKLIVINLWEYDMGKRSLYILSILFLFYMISCSDNEVSEKKKKMKPPYKTFTLGSIFVNLKEKSGRVKLEIKIAHKKSEKLVIEMEMRKDQIVDTIRTIIESTYLKDYRSSKQIDKIKKRIVKKINEYIMNGRIEDIYFVDLRRSRLR